MKGHRLDVVLLSLALASLPALASPEPRSQLIQVAESGLGLISQ